jgi:hypothetical protein
MYLLHELGKTQLLFLSYKRHNIYISFLTNNTLLKLHIYSFKKIAVKAFSSSTVGIVRYGKSTLRDIPRTKQVLYSAQPLLFYSSKTFCLAV